MQISCLGCKRFFLPMLSMVFLVSCSTVSNLKVWPLGDSKPKDRAYKPENATEYQCLNNKRFFVRNLEKGNAVWLILPERELLLEKASAESGKVYSNGLTTFTLGDESSLKIDATTSYVSCKAVLQVK